MATPRIKSTYVMDGETMRTLETIARRWNVSKSEALRRAIHASATQPPPQATDALRALDQLQRSLKLTPARARENLASRRRGSLNDCMIATVALRAGVSVATTNIGDFRRFETAGLRVLGVHGRA